MSAPYPATAAQLRVLRWVYGYQVSRSGISPTIREIRDGLGMAGLGSISMQLRGLEERGHIRRLYNRDRAIEVLHPPAIPTAPDGAPLFAVPLAREGASDG